MEDASLTGNVITASGEYYNVEVIYGEDAGIPENAYLTAEEAEVDFEAVKNAFSPDWHKPEITDIRSFDITLHDEYGTIIEPLASVYVQITHKYGG